MQAPAGGTPPSSTALLNHDTPSIYPHSMIDRRLPKISQKIEWLDIMLHRERCLIPTVREIALYMLIHRHVNLYIQLFQSEDMMTVIKCCSRKIGIESTHSEKKMHIIKSNMDGSSRPAEISLDDLFNKLDDNEAHLDNIWAFLVKCRNSLSQPCVYPLKFAIDGIKLTDNIEGFEMREFQNCNIDTLTKGLNKHENELDHHGKSGFCTDNDIGTNWLAGGETINIELFLRHILSELLDIGRSRSYAPPSEIDIEHYRQIRIRIASSLAYYKAKIYLQPSERRLAKSERIWICEHDYVHNLEYYPKSHLLASTLDYFPGILSLLQECRDYATICSSSFYKYTKGQELGSLQCLTKHQKKFGVGVCQEREVNYDLEKDKKELNNSVNFPTEDKDSAFYKSMTRADCLLEMLDMFEKLKSSFTTTLSVEEVRLLAQIGEHVHSSLWLFHLLNMEHQDQNVQVVHTQNGESRCREDYLHKILDLVEAVRTSCLDIPPNNNEGELYKKLSKYVSDAFHNTNTRALIKGRKRKMDDDAPLDRDYIDDLLKDVYWWHIKWFHKAEGEFVDMLKAILPSLLTRLDQSDNILERISENMNANMVPVVVKLLENELADSAQQKLKLLDEFLLMLYKARKLQDAFVSRIYRNLRRLYNISDGDSALLWEEVSSVLPSYE